MDFELFASFNETEYQYWNPKEEAFQSVNISQLFRFQNAPPSSKLYTVIGLGDAFLIFWAMFLVYSIILGMLKHFINKDFRMASFGARLQHIVEATNMPETYSSDWDTDHELDEKGHLQKWWKVLREMALMIFMQLISNLMMLIPFFVTASNVKARHELLEGAIGVFPEEELAYRTVKILSWILPSIIITSALLDIILVFIYMRIGHPWKYILSNEEHDTEVNETANNSPQDIESNSRQTQRESTIEVTIDTMLENVENEIWERKALREQAHKAILNLDENNSELHGASSCENTATTSGSNEKSNTYHDIENIHIKSPSMSLKYNFIHQVEKIN